MSKIDGPKIDGPLAFLSTTITAIRRQVNSSPAFVVLSRLAACLWFFVLTILFAHGFTDMLRTMPANGAGFADWAEIVSHFCSLLFFATLAWLMLIRPRSVAQHEGIIPTVIAFFGTYSVWLMPFLPRGEVSPGLHIVSAAIAVVGSLSLVCAVFYLGKSFSIAPQARRLVVSGPYKFVRHPLYIAEEIAVIGVALQYAWHAALLFLIVHLTLQIRRMDYEESLLRAVFPDYENYARRVPRLIPGVW